MTKGEELAAELEECAYEKGYNSATYAGHPHSWDEPLSEARQAVVAAIDGKTCTRVWRNGHDECSRCHATLPRINHFCGYCGARIVEEEPKVGLIEAATNLMRFADVEEEK